MPRVLAALERHEPLDEPLCDMLRRCLAVHLARSLTIWQLHQRALSRYREVIDKTVLRRPENALHLDCHFFARHGIWPAGPELRELAVCEELEQLPDLLATMVPERFAENYDRAMQIIGPDAIGVCMARDGEFLIGDAPAQSLSSEKPGIGPLNGVSWTEATTMVMPITRRLAISTEPEAGYIDLDAHGVDVVNSIQIASAFRHVMWHPDADFLELVLKVRPPLDVPA